MNHFVEDFKSVFEKKFGEIEFEQKIKHGHFNIVSFLFNFNDKIKVKILLIEEEKNHWVLHHELSKENIKLSKEIIKCSDRFDNLVQNRGYRLSLSNELKGIKKENFVKTFVRFSLQNRLNKVKLFS